MISRGTAVVALSNTGIALTGTIVVALISLAATAVTAINARKANAQTVSVQFFTTLQQQVAQLNELQSKTQHELERERRKRWLTEESNEEQRKMINALIEALQAANVPLPPNVAPIPPPRVDE